MRLHIDSQAEAAHTVFPVVIQFPSLPPLVCETVSSQEIMADKLIAVACRSYLGGRDLFDLWFHWLRRDNWQEDVPEILGYTWKKIGDRNLVKADFTNRLTEHLGGRPSLMRARTEWKRYLPLPFQKKEVQEAIRNACQRLPGIFS